MSEYQTSQQKSMPLRQLETLHRRREELMAVLLTGEEFAVGTVSWVMRRCGNPNCRCAKTPTHRQMQFLFTEDGRRRCKLVRRSDEARVMAAGERYRQFRQALRELRNLNSDELAILRSYRDERGLTYK